MNFDEVRERREQLGTEWKYGAVETDLAAIPLKKKAGLPIGKYRGANSPKWKGGCAAKNARQCIKRRTLHLCSDCGVGYYGVSGCNSKYCPDCRNTLCICSYCLKDFFVNRKAFNGGRGLYCSRFCAIENYKLSPLRGAKLWNWRGGVNSTKMRRARLANASGFYTERQWQELKHRYNYMCLCCKRQEPLISLTRDHIVPLAIGGSNDISNIQPLCGQCNRRKSTKIINYTTVV